MKQPMPESEMRDRAAAASGQANAGPKAHAGGQPSLRRRPWLPLALAKGESSKSHVPGSLSGSTAAKWMGRPKASASRR